MITCTGGGSDGPAPPERLLRLDRTSATGFASRDSANAYSYSGLSAYLTQGESRGWQAPGSESAYLSQVERGCEKPHGQNRHACRSRRLPAETSTQTPARRVRPDRHCDSPSRHCFPVAQLMPHALQLSTSVATSTQLADWLTLAHCRVSASRGPLPLQLS